MRRKQQIRNLVIVGATLAVILAYNNCGPVAFDPVSDSSQGSQDTPLPPGADDGTPPDDDAGPGLPPPPTPIPPPDNGGMGPRPDDSFNPDCVFTEILISDSFEGRREIDASAGNPFGWRRVVDDLGRVGTSADRVGAEIFNTNPLGPAAAGVSSVYFYGRPGSSVHNVFLVSTALPLENRPEYGISFNYLPIGLEAGEYLKLEVCNGTAAACGVGPTFNAAGLRNGPWVTIFQGSSTGRYSTMNGINHQRADWIHHSIRIPVVQFPAASGSLVFRFNAFMNSGFRAFNGRVPVESRGIEDAVGLDAVNVGVLDCD